MLLALILTFIFSGLGIIYAGNLTKGLVFVAARILLPFLGVIHPIFFVLTIIVWIWSFYETYREVKFANGFMSPNLANDIKALINEVENWSLQKKLLVLFAVFLIVMIFVFISIYLTYLPPSHVNTHSYFTTGSSGGSGHHYGGVDTSPSRIASSDPDWYYDYYEYGDFPYIDDYLESQGF